MKKLDTEKFNKISRKRHLNLNKLLKEYFTKERKEKKVKKKE